MQGRTSVGGGLIVCCISSLLCFMAVRNVMALILGRLILNHSFSANPFIDTPTQMELLNEAVTVVSEYTETDKVQEVDDTGCGRSKERGQDPFSREFDLGTTLSGSGSLPARNVKGERGSRVGARCTSSRCTWRCRGLIARVKIRDMSSSRLNSS